MVLPHAALWLEIRTYLINPGLASGVRLTSRWLGPTSPDLASWLDSAPLGTSCRPTGRRMGKQLLRIAGYATGWIVSGWGVNQEQSGLGDQDPTITPVTQSRSDQFWRANGSIAEMRGHLDPAAHSRQPCACRPSARAPRKPARPLETRADGSGPPPLPI